MGLDYGSRTVGVALSDPLRITSQPFETVERKSENKLRQTLARLEEIIKDSDVQEIVLGCPFNMDGSAGERVEKTMQFKELLEKRVGIEVVLQDERLTTIAADEKLEEMKIPRENRKKYIDQVAASIILEDYMNMKRS